MLELDQLKAMLEHARHERSASVGSRADIVIEQAADALDQTQSAAQRDLAVSLLNRETATYRQVEQALKRIAEGTYGVCTACEETISAKRLRAVPWAKLCLSCQETLDAKDRHFGHLEETDGYEGL